MKSLLFCLSLLTAGAGTAESDPTANYLVVGEDRIYYEISGAGDPLVLVSGGSGMDLRQWDRITPQLNQSYRVIRYDPRGLGKSDNPTVRYADSDDLVLLLDHLSIQQAGIIGLSSAGGFVLEFALTNPRRVTGVVAAAPFVPGFEFSAAMLARLEHFNRAAEQGRESFLDAMFEDAHFIPAPLNPGIRQPARENMGFNFDKGADFDPNLPAVLEPPLIDQLEDIHVPVLLLAGELDHPEVSRRNQFLLSKIPRSRELIVSEAGHNAPQENPRAFVDAVLPFLEEIGGK